MTSRTPQTEYWFARRFPLSDPRQAQAPVHWKGWMVVAGFFGTMALGAAALVWFGGHDELVKGAALFALAAFIGGLWYVSVARVRGDRIRCVKDYRGGKPIA